MVIWQHDLINQNYYTVTQCPTLRLHHNKYKTHCSARESREERSLLQLQTDSIGVQGAYAAWFRGFLPLIRHLYLDGRPTQIPHNLVVDGGVCPYKVRKILVLGCVYSTCL